MSTEKSVRVKLCGAWKRQAKDGTPYIMGSLSYSSKIMIYPNKYKKNEKDPDYHVSILPDSKDVNEVVAQDFPDVPF